MNLSAYLCNEMIPQQCTSIKFTKINPKYTYTITHTYILTHLHMYIHTSMHACKHTSICTYILRIYTHICLICTIWMCWNMLDALLCKTGWLLVPWSCLTTRQLGKGFWIVGPSIWNVRSPIRAQVIRSTPDKPNGVYKSHKSFFL